MASGETTVTVVGNLTDDPELRFTPKGDGMARFRVASTPRVFDRQSNAYRDGEPLFLQCTAWREQAVHLAESLTKGARVIVTGRLRLSQWQTKEGEKRSMIQLEVDEVGPSLRFATAKVQKMTRTSGGRDGFTPDAPPDDPFMSAAPAGSAKDPFSISAPASSSAPAGVAAGLGAQERAA
jgi:single-strand DNA-binding protein